MALAYYLLKYKFKVKSYKPEPLGIGLKCGVKFTYVVAHGRRFDLVIGSNE